jgi:hypothetical protein
VPGLSTPVAPPARPLPALRRRPAQRGQPSAHPPPGAPLPLPESRLPAPGLRRGDARAGRAARRAAIEQAAVFQQRRAEFERDYAGQYIFLRNGRVERATASLAEMSEWASRQMAQDVFGLTLKVEPAPAATERLEAYV